MEAGHRYDIRGFYLSDMAEKMFTLDRASWQVPASLFKKHPIKQLSGLIPFRLQPAPAGHPGSSISLPSFWPPNRKNSYIIISLSG